MPLFTRHTGRMPTNTDSADFTATIAGAVRAELARQGKSRSAIAGVIGVHRVTAYSRLNGTTPFTSKELEQVARFLGIDTYDLIASAQPRPVHAAGEVEHPLPPIDPWAQPRRARKAG